MPRATPLERLAKKLASQHHFFNSILTSEHFDSPAISTRCTVPFATFRAGSFVSYSAYSPFSCFGWSCVERVDVVPLERHGPIGTKLLMAHLFSIQLPSFDTSRPYLTSDRSQTCSVRTACYLMVTSSLLPSVALGRSSLLLLSLSCSMPFFTPSLRI